MKIGTTFTATPELAKVIPINPSVTNYDNYDKIAPLDPLEVHVDLEALKKKERNKKIFAVAGIGFLAFLFLK